MKRGLSRFIPIIFLIVVFVLIIAAGVSVVRLFTGNDNGPTQEVVKEEARRFGLLNTNADRSVLMRLRGNIVGDEDFRTYTVQVSPEQRQFTRYKGYLEKPLVDKTYSNNVEAYDQFVNALAAANFATGTPLTGSDDDTRGLCATGVLYEFEIRSGENVEKRFWTTTCRGSNGSLKANADQLRALFLKQVPEAEQYIGKD